MADAPSMPPPAAGIGTLREGPLHAALKAWYRRPGDRLEAPVDGYVVDILRGALAIEIQTGNFAALRTKVAELARARRVRVVHPVPVRRRLVRLGAGGLVLSRRRSPLRGTVWDAFSELVAAPWMLCHPRVDLEVVLVEEEVLQLPPARPGRRRRTAERRLVAVRESVLMRTPADALALVPAGLPEPLTSGDLARAGGIPLHVAQRATYCLRHAGALEACGRRGRSIAYRRPRRDAGTARRNAKT
jgi:hypothetical protein